MHAFMNIYFIACVRVQYYLILLLELSSYNHYEVFWGNLVLL